MWGGKYCWNDKVITVNVNAIVWTRSYEDTVKLDKGIVIKTVDSMD